MKLKHILRSLFIGSASFLTVSCTDYLDVSKEIAKSLDKKEVFSNSTYLKRWYNAMYKTMQDYAETGYTLRDNTYGDNVWAIYSGELYCAHPTIIAKGTNTFTPSSAEFHRWATVYKGIRQAMIFLRDCPESLGNPADMTNYLSPEAIKRMKADAIYLMAYDYFLLFELYGPVPIIPEIADPEDESLDYPRASVQELLEHIDGLLAQLLEGGEYAGILPESYYVPNYTPSDGSVYSPYNDMMRPTVATVLALRARLWVYAASPLFNGGYKEALALTDKAGKHLFESEDPGRWETAKEYLNDLLDYADSHDIRLNEVLGADGELDPYQSIYTTFQDMNNELIWASPNGTYYTRTTEMEPRTAPFSLNYASGMGGNVGPYQNIVDLFFTKDGLDKDEDSNYAEDGFATEWVNPYNDKSHKDKHIYKMYVNREPRFYADVTYEGKSWHIQPTGYADWGTYFSIPDKSSYKGDDTNARSGYLLYKFNNHKITPNSGGVSTVYRPMPYFRLADFYLYYAEACMETDDLETAIEYVDKVRTRAGIPTYEGMNMIGKWAGGNGTAADLQNKEAVREAIYRERILEMFGEGNYYFDMRRWMRAGWSQDEKGVWLQKDNEDKNLPRYGMDIKYSTVNEFTDAYNKVAKSFVGKVGPGSYYNRIMLDQFPWKKAMLLYPVPYNEMQKSKLMVQNPLWD